MNALMALRILFSLYAAAVAATTSHCSCSKDAIPVPTLFGAEILNLTAYEELNRTISAVHYEAHWILSYCSVNISYTHSGWKDLINVEIWLPLADWNGRFLGVGGGTWASSNGAEALAPALAAGYATAGTDGGHTLDMAVPPSAWALSSPGNVNYELLQNFAFISLSDMTLLAQAVTETLYDKPAHHSYWEGCSQGGRQRLMLAQRYPELYDGILAKVPVIDVFVLADYWPQQVMNTLGTHPAQCEMEAFTQAAVRECDGLDGLVDGVIVDESLCHFEPMAIVGQPFNCSGETRLFTEAGAQIASAAWTGPIDANGKRYWYGLGHDAPLAVVANTTILPNGTTIGVPNNIATDFIKTFVYKDPAFDLTTMTDEEYFALFQRSRNEYGSILATSDPDLSAFKTAGGKLLTWHGMADPLVHPNGTVDYFERVSAIVPNAQSFFRHFQAPGVWHCQGGPGLQVTGDLDALVDWVENGKVPDDLRTVRMSANGEVEAERHVCAWPKVQKHVAGDPTLAESFTCM